MKTDPDLLIRSSGQRKPEGLLNQVVASKAGWDDLNLEILRLTQGGSWKFRTEDEEAALVLLGGQCSVKTSRNCWEHIGRRANVFEGMPWAVYCSRGSELLVKAESESLECAFCHVPASRDYPERLITPEDSSIEIRGGGHATRQINSILPPGFACQKLVCVEVYTPGGNWSSYPPHKHDVHRTDPSGNILEADLEEIYFYRFRQPEGFAIQRIYNDSKSLDVTLTVQDLDVVLVPEGYHPVSAPWGYDCYYLNFLSGSAQSLAGQDDPDHAWVKDAWTWKDPRVPLVSHDMEKGAKHG
ncbi:MAG: 5-deoxy-glucuronate isomerase [Candidatus Omnitrophica bacterium]|nr:5-deoxy-glucuronate isomerase [Candidatus Omnitrophota bacterium]